MRTHLVTGAAGFVGMKAVRAILDRGDAVRATDLEDTGEFPSGVEFTPGDILDPAHVRRVLRGVDHVHHAAALVPLAKAGKKYAKVNTDGTRIMAEAALEARVRSFVFVSSSTVFGIPHSFPITDSTPLAPFEDYGRSKVEAEKVLLEAASRGLKAAILRPRTIIGSERLGIFEILFQWVREGRKVYIIGDGRNPYQFLHVDDLVEAMLLSADREVTGCFNLGTDRFGTLREALEALIRHAGTRSRVASVPPGLAIPVLRTLDLLRLSPLAPWHYMTYHKPYYFDLTKAEAELGWHPRYSNDEMLREAYDWYVGHPPSAERGASVHRKAVKKGILGLVRRLS